MKSKYIRALIVPTTLLLDRDLKFHSSGSWFSHTYLKYCPKEELAQISVGVDFVLNPDNVFFGEVHFYERNFKAVSQVDVDKIDYNSKSFSKLTPILFRRCR